MSLLLCPLFVLKFAAVVVCFLKLFFTNHKASKKCEFLAGWRSNRANDFEHDFTLISIQRKRMILLQLNKEKRSAVLPCLCYVTGIRKSQRFGNIYVFFV